MNTGYIVTGTGLAQLERVYKLLSHTLPELPTDSKEFLGFETSDEYVRLFNYNGPEGNWSLAYLPEGEHPYFVKKLQEIVGKRNVTIDNQPLKAWRQ